jgi:hypothetical protein
MQALLHGILYDVLHYLHFDFGQNLLAVPINFIWACFLVFIVKNVQLVHIDLNFWLALLFACICHSICSFNS